MKKFLLLAIIAFTTANVNAQEKAHFGRGSWMVGGNVSFNRTTQDIAGFTLVANTTDVSSQIGYFVTSRLALTLNPSYSRTNFKVMNSPFRNNEGAREYILEFGLRNYLFGGLFLSAKVGGGQSKITETSIDSFGNSTISSSYVGFTTYGLGVGYSFFLIKSVSLEPLVFRRFNNADGSISTDLNFSLGFRVFL